MLLASLSLLLWLVLAQAQPFPTNLPLCDNTVWSPIIANPAPRSNNPNFAVKLAQRDPLHAEIHVVEDHRNLSWVKSGYDGIFIHGQYPGWDNVRPDNSPIDKPNRMVTSWYGDSSFEIWGHLEDDMTYKANSFVVRLNTSTFDRLYHIYSEFDSTTEITTVYAIPKYWDFFNWWYLPTRVTVYESSQNVSHFDAVVHEDLVYITLHQLDKEVLVLTSPDMLTFTPQGRMYWTIDPVDQRFLPDQYDMFSSHGGPEGSKIWIYFSEEYNQYPPHGLHDWTSVLCHLRSYTEVFNCQVYNIYTGREPWRDISNDLFDQLAVRGAASRDGTQAILARAGWLTDKENRGPDELPVVAWSVVKFGPPNHSGGGSMGWPQCKETFLAWKDNEGNMRPVNSLHAPGIAAHLVHEIAPGYPIGLAWTQYYVGWKDETEQSDLYTLKGNPFIYGSSNCTTRCPD